MPRTSLPPVSTASAPAAAAPTRAFRVLIAVAITLTFALVIVGGVVRISDSGLGCGPAGSGSEGWPLCGGRVIPLVDTNMIVEYAHRVLAGAAALVIGALALLAWRRYREHRGLFRVAVATFGLVLFQAALGGLTVEKGLKQELVAAHLGVAMVQLALLLTLAYLVRPTPGEAPVGFWSVLWRSEVDSSYGARSSGASTGLQVLAVAASVAVLGTIVAGGYMSASQLRGTDQARVDVHTACGTDFPTCGGEVLPFGRSREVDIHLTHRAFMYLASALVLALFVAILWSRRDGRRPGAPGGSGRSEGGSPPAQPKLIGAASLTVALLLAQVLLGAINVWAGEHPWLVVMHLVFGTLLWSSLVYLTLLVVRSPRTSEARAPRETSRAEAVPA